MSFILDSLSRAQALRSRKTSALAQAASPSAAWVARQRRSLWQALALAGLGAGVAVAALWSLRPAAPVAPAAAPAVAAAAPPSSSVVIPGAIPAMGSMPRQVPRPVPKFVPPTNLSQPLPLPPPSPRPGRATAAVVATGVAAGVPPPPSLAPPVAVAEPEEVKPLSELPTQLQVRIARVKVGLYVYAPQRGRRFVMVEGRQLREGDELIPGVRLDEITEAGMVLQYNGLRVLAPQR